MVRSGQVRSGLVCSGLVWSGLASQTTKMLLKKYDLVENVPPGQI